MSQGDIRLTPFYNAAECQKKVEEYVADINAKLHYLPTRGPCSKYAIKKADGEDFKGSIELEWNGEPFKGARPNGPRTSLCRLSDEHAPEPDWFAAGVQGLRASWTPPALPR